jgi:transposase
MAVALSFDRRRRVVAAVEGGVSCRAAADRFGVARSTAIKRLRRWRRARGGDKRSHRLEAHAAAILASVDEAPAITLAEIVAHLQEQHDPTVAPRARVKGHGLAAARPPRVRLQNNGARDRAAAGRRPAAAARLVRGPAGASAPRLPGARKRRSLRDPARGSADTLRNASGDASETFTSDDCRDDCQAAGYDVE